MRQLPVTGALGHAFKSTLNNAAFAIHISWPWMAILLPLNVAANLYLILNGWADPEKADPRMLTVMLPLLALSLVAYASIAVNWHRYVLLDEVPQGWARLRLDGLMWRYIGNGLLIGVILAAGAIVAAIVVTLASYVLGSVVGDVLALIVVPALIAVYAYVLVAAYRLSVKLPAVALGRTDFGLGQAWAATDGNFWQLLGLIVMFIACVFVAGLGVFLFSLLFGALGTFGLALALGIQVLVNWVATILGVTLLTSLYGFFVEGRNF
jgi:hypothetical protein